MAAQRYYSSNSGQMSLSSDISAAATSMVVDSVVGLPGTTPFTLVLDRGSIASEEIVEVTNVSGTTLTITRAVDGTSAKAHVAGAEVRHMATGRDFREPQEHIGASTDVHGVGAGSAVVGTNTVQTLKNKTAEAGSAATVGFAVKGAASQTADYLTVETSGGTDLVRVKPGEGTLTLPGTAEFNEGSSANFWKYVARFTSSASDVVAGIFRRKAGQTVNILEVQDESGTALASFDKDGKLTTPAITSPTITALTAADTALDGRLTAAEGDRPKSSTTKKDKRIHWGTATASVVGAGGVVTFTHGCGFTPTVFIPIDFEDDGSTGDQAFKFGITSLSSTTAVCVAYKFDGTYLPNGTSVGIQFFAGE